MRTKWGKVLFWPDDGKTSRLEMITGHENDQPNGTGQFGQLTSWCYLTKSQAGVLAKKLLAWSKKK